MESKNEKELKLVCKVTAIGTGIAIVIFTILVQCGVIQIIH